MKLEESLIYSKGRREGVASEGLGKWGDDELGVGGGDVDVGRRGRNDKVENAMQIWDGRGGREASLG